jgi:GntR family transcriptional repressor for pyruvate dehydrogenase complex
MGAITPRAIVETDRPSPAQRPAIPSQLLPRSDLSALIARKIVEHILTHDLQPGDRLPSMQALADRFAVANPTVREALRRLQATGEVELRQGSGTYVGQGRKGLVLANPNVSALTMEDLIEIMSARLVVEPHLAGLAAERADVADIAELDDLLRETERHLFPNDSTSDQPNNTFHLAIARVAREPVLAQIDRALLELYGSGYCPEFHPGRGRSKDLHDHIGILSAIRAGDAALATARMRQHLTESRQDVEARLAEAGQKSAEAVP